MAVKVFQRGDGRFAVKFKDKKGKWAQRTFAKEQEARKLALELEEDEKQNNRMTVAEIMLAYVQNHELCDSKVKSYYRLISEGGYAEGIANKFVDALNRRDLELVRSACRANKLKSQTINSAVGMLQAAFNWGADQELIPDNPWRKYRRLKVTEKRSLTATPEEFAAVYQILPAYMQWACRTCLALSLRPGKELVSLKWEQFNWKQGYVKVYMFKVKAWKTVFPPRAYWEEAVAKARSASSPYVVVGTKGQNLSPHALVMAWNYSCQKAKVKIPMYCMRHLAASLALEAGGTLTGVASQMGHATPKTTEEFYLHSNERSQREAGAALALPYGELFGKKW